MPEFGTFKFGEARFGGDTIYISPDLGWANRALMLDPVENPAVVSIVESDWSSTSDPPKDYISPAYRIIYYFTTPVELPEEAVFKLHGHGMRYYYRAASEVAEGRILSFILRLEP